MISQTSESFTMSLCCTQLHRLERSKNTQPPCRGYHLPDLPYAPSCVGRSEPEAADCLVPSHTARTSQVFPGLPRSSQGHMPRTNGMLCTNERHGLQQFQQFQDIPRLSLENLRMLQYATIFYHGQPRLMVQSHRIMILDGDMSSNCYFGLLNSSQS